jgi:hypothetical protein
VRVDAILSGDEEELAFARRLIHQTVSFVSFVAVPHAASTAALNAITLLRKRNLCSQA